MRARFIRSGRARGRYLVPVSAAAAVALAAGTVVAINPVTQSDDITLTQSEAIFGGGAEAGVDGPTPTVGAEFSYSLKDLAEAAGFAELAATLDFSTVTFEGLPDGVTYNPDTGIISGTPTTPGEYNVVIKIGDQVAGNVDITVGAEGTTDGNIGGNIGGDANLELGSLGDGPMGEALQQLLISLGISGALASGSLNDGSIPGTPGDDTPGDDTPGDETPGDDTPGGDTGNTTSLGNLDLSSLATLIPGLAGSTGTGEVTPENPGDETEGTVEGGSLDNFPGGMGSGGDTTPDNPETPGDETEASSLQNLGSSTVPSSDANGSAEALIPGLAISGTVLLGLALLAALANGSSVPSIPGMGSSGPAGSTGTGSDEGPVSGPGDSGSTGSAAPAAPAPEPAAPAPGPDVANGRG